MFGTALDTTLQTLPRLVSRSEIPFQIITAAIQPKFLLELDQVRFNPSILQKLLPSKDFGRVTQVSFEVFVAQFYQIRCSYSLLVLILFEQFRFVVFDVTDV